MLPLFLLNLYWISPNYSLTTVNYLVAIMKLILIVVMRVINLSSHQILQQDLGSLLKLKALIICALCPTVCYKKNACLVHQGKCSGFTVIGHLHFFCPIFFCQSLCCSTLLWVSSCYFGFPCPTVFFFLNLSFFHCISCILPFWAF